jgi:hypothetical protein
MTAARESQTHPYQLPECVQGQGAAAARGDIAPPRPALYHSHRSGPVPVTLSRRQPPERACEGDPLAGFAPCRAAQAGSGFRAR